MEISIQIHTFVFLYFGQVAQLVEQWTENPRVGGSTPSLTTKNESLRPETLIMSGFFFLIENFVLYSRLIFSDFVIDSLNFQSLFHRVQLHNVHVERLAYVRAIPLQCEELSQLL